MTNRNHHQNMHGQCQKYLYHHVTFTTNEGQTYDGIIEHVDGNQVTVLVGEDVMDRSDASLSETRQIYGPGFGVPRYRRFRRLAFPLAALTTLALLPYLAPPVYPYPYPPYAPYPYPPYPYPYY